MSVLLINPPYMRRVGSSSVEPIGLASLAAALIQAGSQVEILDLAAAAPDWPHDERVIQAALAQSIDSISPSLIGIGPLVTASLRSTKQLLEFTRALTDARLVVGGPLCAAPGFGTVASDYLRVDAYVAGDGEDALVSLWSILQSGSWPSRTGEVEGLGIPGDVEPKPHRIFDLDRLNPPRRALLTRGPTLPSARRSMGASKTTAAFLSRGCPYSCTFCAAPLSSGRRVRRFSSDWVIQEIRNIAALGYDNIVFYDDCLFVRGAKLDRRISEFVHALETAGWKGTYQLELRCDAAVTMSSESLQALADAGMRQANMGIEKAHVSSLKQIRKRLDPDVARAACARLRKYGVRAAGTFILGGVGESPDDLLSIIEFACSLPLDFAHFNPLAIYPGTQLFNQVFGMGTPWLALCLDKHLAPRGDLLWRSESVPVELIRESVLLAYERFYSDVRLGDVLRRAPVTEHIAIEDGYALLARSRAESVLPAAEWLAC